MCRMPMLTCRASLLVISLQPWVQWSVPRRICTKGTRCIGAKEGIGLPMLQPAAFAKSPIDGIAISMPWSSMHPYCDGTSHFIFISCSLLVFGFVMGVQMGGRGTSEYIGRYETNWYPSQVSCHGWRVCCNRFELRDAWMARGMLRWCDIGTGCEMVTSDLQG